MVSFQISLCILCENIKTISINPQSQMQIVFQQLILPFLFQIYMYKFLSVV